MTHPLVFTSKNVKRLEVGSKTCMGPIHFECQTFFGATNRWQSHSRACGHPISASCATITTPSSRKGQTSAWFCVYVCLCFFFESWKKKHTLVDQVSRVVYFLMTIFIFPEFFFSCKFDYYHWFSFFGGGEPNFLYHKIEIKIKIKKSSSRALCLSEMKEGLSSSTDSQFWMKPNWLMSGFMGYLGPIVTNTSSIGSQLWLSSGWTSTELMLGWCWVAPRPIPQRIGPL